MKTLLKLSVQQALCRTPESAAAVFVSLGKGHLFASGALQLHADFVAVGVVTVSELSWQQQEQNSYPPAYTAIHPQLYSSLN